jgi:L-lactate dehydrogenase complex protein LldE
MGLDRLEDHRRAGTQVITATDMSCLMHLDGLARRAGYPFRILHIAELLDASWAEPQQPAGAEMGQTAGKDSP